VSGDGDVQFRLRIRLPHHPQRRQQMHRVAEKAEVKDHDFLGGAGALVKIFRAAQGHGHSLALSVLTTSWN